MPLKSGLVFRPAGASDWPAVASLLEANRLPLEGAREHLANYLLVETEGVVGGCAGIEDYGSVVLLRSVVVAPSLLGQGLGKALVERVLREAARRGARQACLLTTTAPDYFERLGFQRGPVAEAPSALAASAELRGACPAAAIFMSRDLAGLGTQEQPRTAPS